MVSAIQIIVDVYLPVAMNVISSAIEIVELADAERSDALHQATEKLLQRRRLRVEVHKDETLPGFHPDRNQTILRAIKVLHSLERRRQVLPQAAWKQIPPASATGRHVQPVARSARTHRAAPTLRCASRR